MYKLIKYACLLTLSLPAAAMAAPTNPVDPAATLGTVITHVTGTATSNPALLEQLGVTPPQASGELPYELTLTSYTDWPRGRPGGSDGNVGFYPNHLAVDFQIGGAEYHYDGAGGSTVYLSISGDRGQYTHYLEFPASNEAHPFAFLRFYGGTNFASGSFATDGPFTPGHVESGGLGAFIEVEYAYLDPGQEDWRHDRIHGYIATSSVDVTSPVPEPASYAMLAAGVLGLGLRRRFGRARA